MSIPEDKLKELRDDLQWVSVDDYLKGGRASRGIYDFIIPAGCLATTAILANGLRALYQKNSRKQQMYMRYRVLAQGLTIAAVIMGLFHVRSSG